MTSNNRRRVTSSRSLGRHKKKKPRGNTARVRHEGRVTRNLDVVTVKFVPNKGEEA